MSFFYSIRKNAVKNVNSWNIDYSNRVYDSLNRGQAVLTSNDQLDRYLHSYGKKHPVKLNHAFSAVRDQAIFSQNLISIVDYGCGQALASVVLCDYFNDNKIDTDIRSLKLLDASSVAVARGVQYVSDLLPTAQTSSFVNCMDDVSLADLKIHLLSNILDVPQFHIKLLVDKILATQSGKNLFVIVSPNYNNQHRIDQFKHLIQRSAVVDWSMPFNMRDPLPSIYGAVFLADL